MAKISLETEIMDKGKRSLLTRIIGLSPNKAFNFLNNINCVGVIVELNDEEIDVNIDGKGKVLMTVKNGKVISYVIS